MKLFSKRNKRDNFTSTIYKAGQSISRDGDFFSRRQKRAFEFINSNARTRLISLIKFLTSSDTFLEKYILVDNRKEKIHYLNKKLLDDFSESELGYKFSNHFDFYPFKFKSQTIKIQENQTDIAVFDDYVLFDLLETTILFSKKKQRKNVITRIAGILREEETGFFIKENLITKDGGEDLKNISIQLKDKKLSSKINSFYSFLNENDFINASKISAEILNIVISDEKQTKKKTIEHIWKNVSKSIISNEIEKSKLENELITIIDDISNVCKTLNNRIYDVRHSEKDRIKISNEYFYKLICSYNISLIEVILTSLKDAYISSEDWEEIKNKYIESYKINKDTFYYVPEPKEEDFDIDNIPF